MSDLPERRDQTVLNLLNEIRKEQTDQGKELAANTVETRGLKEEVRTLNGKVVGHETRLQSIESDKAVAARLESKREEDEKGKGDTYRRWSDKVLWGAFLIFMIIVYKVLVETNIISDFLK
jgi:hypothetical protein